MNWIEIDQMLYGMLKRHTDIKDVYAEAQKQFKWDAKQAKDAVDPLVQRSKWIGQVDQESVAKKAQKRKTLSKQKQTSRKS
jgi:hypothetical protein